MPKNKKRLEQEAEVISSCNYWNAFAHSVRNDELQQQQIW